MVHVDAHKARGAHILGDGAHGLAELGLLDQEGEDRGGRGGHKDGKDGSAREARVSDLEAAKVPERGYDLSGGAEHELAAVLEEIRNADGGDQDREARGVAKRGIGDLVNEHAQGHAAGHG